MKNFIFLTILISLVLSCTIGQKIRDRAISSYDQLISPKDVDHYFRILFRLMSESREGVTLGEKAARKLTTFHIQYKVPVVKLYQIYVSVTDHGVNGVENIIRVVEDRIIADGARWDNSLDSGKITNVFSQYDYFLNKRNVNYKIAQALVRLKYKFKSTNEVVYQKFINLQSNDPALNGNEAIKLLNKPSVYQSSLFTPIQVSNNTEVLSNYRKFLDKEGVDSSSARWLTQFIYEYEIDEIKLYSLYVNNLGEGKSPPFAATEVKKYLDKYVLKKVGFELLKIDQAIDIYNKFRFKFSLDNETAEYLANLKMVVAEDLETVYRIFTSEIENNPEKNPSELAFSLWKLHGTKTHQSCFSIMKKTLSL